MTDREILFHENLMKCRSSTVNTRHAHLKKLQSMNIDINNLNNDNIVDILKQLQTTSNKNGRKLTPSYINIIYSTLRRLNPSLTVKISKLGFSRRGRLVIDNPLNNIEIIGLKELIITIFRYAVTFKEVNYLRVPSRATIDTAIAMVLILITNLSFNQLVKLRVRDLKTIAHDNSISITIKSGNSAVKVKKMANLYNPLFICVVNMVLSREEFMKRNFINNVDVKYNRVNIYDYNDEDYCDRINVNKIDDDDVQVISCKKDSINKTIHELYMRFHKKKSTISLGITLIEKMKKIKKIKDDLIDTEKILSLLSETNDAKEDSESLNAMDYQ